jgi:hypothetical protein
MLVTGNTENSITVDTTDNSSQTTALNLHGWSLAAGNLVEIIVGDTLASLFGNPLNGKELTFSGGTSAFRADTLGFYNKATSRFDVYFYSTALNYWRSSSSTINANSLVIYPNSAIGVTRRASRPLVSMTIIGDVPLSPSLIKHTGSNTNVYVSSTYPADMTLGSLNLTNWTKSNSAFGADTLGIYNPATSRFDVYFQRLDNTWRLVGGGTADQSNVPIGPTSGFGLLRRSTVTGVSSFIQIEKPYTL